MSLLLLILVTVTYVNNMYNVMSNMDIKTKAKTELQHNTVTISHLRPNSKSSFTIYAHSITATENHRIKQYQSTTVIVAHRFPHIS